MAIEINRAWTVTGSGADYAGTNTVGDCNTSNLADNMKHTAYSLVRSIFWRGLWDWTDSSVTTEVRNLSRQAVNRANDMIDNSFCWSGLGAESALSNLKYINYIGYRLNTESSRVEYQDNNNNTPWSFDIYSNYEPDESWANLTYPLANWRNSRNTYAKRYSFRNYNNTSNPNNLSDFWGSRDNSYCSCNLYPIHKIALRNWINLIVVLAKPTVQSDRSTIRAFDLRTYCDSAHENYPIVIRVLLVPFMYSNNYQNYRTVTMSTGENDRPHLSLTLYRQPAYAGKHIFTSGDDYDNVMWDSVWRSGSIVPPDSTGRTSGNYDELQFRGNDNINHSVAMTNYIMIMGMLTGCGNASYGSGNISWGKSYAEANLYAIRFEDTLLIECGTDKWKEEEFTSDTDWLCFCREFDSTFEEECKRQAACFGMFFTDSYTVAYNGDLVNENMFLGILDDENIGHGNYSKGYANAVQKQWDWTDSTDADYNPEYNPTPPDPNTYGTPWNYNSPDMCNTGQQYYSLTGANVEKIVGDLWAALDTKPSDISVTDYCKEKYLSNNPLDVVVSLKRFPFELPTGAQQNPENIVLGTFETSAEGYTLPLSYKWIYLGSCSLYEYFGGNFLDYDLTTAQLYIPFCGTIEIDVPFFMGKGLEIYMAVDYYTGACTAYVQRVEDKMVYATVNGNCSIDLPITGIQSATLNSTLLNAKQSVIGGAVGAVGKTIAGAAAIGAATVATGGAALVGGLIGGAASAASGLLSGAQADAKNYELHHTQIPLKQIGANSGQNSWCGELRPILYLYRPIIADNYNAADYGHTIGFATCVSDTIGNYSGYLEATNVDLSGFAATDEEKTAINNLLVRGVYL